MFKSKTCFFNFILHETYKYSIFLCDILPHFKNTYKFCWNGFPRCIVLCKSVAILMLIYNIYHCMMNRYALILKLGLITK